MKELILLFTLFGISFGMQAQITELPNGNVGIGITTPSRKLEVFSGLGNSNEVQLRLGTATQYFWDIGRDMSSGNFKIIDNATNVRFHINQSNGNVGIGTTTPSRKLEVFSGLGNSNEVQLRLGTSTQYFWDIGRDMSSGNFKIIDNATNVRFYINQSDGNVGIGTINPGSWKLAVSGNIRAKEIKVETGWSDFVFHKNYDLPTLSEVENHIKEKGHLKDIPSAEEVEENGVFLGEMDSKLLQKIEELTLYTIQQEKEIQKLKEQGKEISELKLLVEKLLKAKE